MEKYYATSTKIINVFIPIITLASQGETKTFFHRINIWCGLYVAGRAAYYGNNLSISLITQQ